MFYWVWFSVINEVVILRSEELCNSVVKKEGNGIVYWLKIIDILRLGKKYICDKIFKVV